MPSAVFVDSLFVQVFDFDFLFKAFRRKIIKNQTLILDERFWNHRRWRLQRLAGLKLQVNYFQKVSFVYHVIKYCCVELSVISFSTKWKTKRHFLEIYNLYIKWWALDMKYKHKLESGSSHEKSNFLFTFKISAFVILQPVYYVTAEGWGKGLNGIYEI